MPKPSLHLLNLLAMSLLVALAACAKAPEEPVVEPTQDTGEPPAQPVDADGDGYMNDADCDDADAAIYPGAEELCDALDNNCDNRVDGADATDLTEWSRDEDGDGFGDPTSRIWACWAPAGFVLDSTDCDDQNGAVNPSAIEVCDEGEQLDNDCSGDAASVDVPGAKPYYRDADKDGFGDERDPWNISLRCEPSLTYRTSEPGDCNDQDESAFTGQTESFADPIKGTEDDYDFNCDGVETPMYTELGSCPETLMLCEINAKPGVVYRVPECSEEGDYIKGCKKVLTECVPVVETITQTCN